MVNRLPRTLFSPALAVATFVVATFLLCAAQTGVACETLPDLHIAVTAPLDAAQVNSDYTLAEIAALAGRLHRDTNRELLGFYTGEFSYQIDIAPAGDEACPARVEATVTLRLQYRLIEIGQEVVANPCLYPAALRHYRRLAEVDQQIVERFSARTAAMLTAAGPALKEIHPSHAEGRDAALREQIRGVVEQAIAPLHDARRDAQQAINNSAELSQLAHSCSI
jgi:hypothetical protein